MSVAALLRWCVWACLFGCGLFAPVQAQMLQWQHLSDGGTGDPAMRPMVGERCDRQALLATDAQGHSVVVSSYQDRFATGGLVTRYRSDGRGLWQTSHRPDGARMHAVALHWTDGGQVLSLRNSTPGALHDRCRLEALDPDTGSVRWAW